MNISISPIKPNNINFCATQNNTNNKGAKEKKIITPQQAMEKRTKITVGCCLAAVFVVDVLYFIMKGSFKNHKVQQKEAKLLKAQAAELNKPKTILELLDKTKHKNIISWYKRVIGQR